MANQVFANNMEISCKAADGKSCLLYTSPSPRDS